MIRRREELTANMHKATPRGGLVVCGARANGLLAPARRLDVSIHQDGVDGISSAGMG